METRKSFFTLKLSYCKEILIIKLLLKTPATRTHGTINMFLLMTLYCKEITKQDDSETTRYRIFYEATTFVVTRIQTHDLPIRVFSSAITSNAILCCSVLFEQKNQATKKHSLLSLLLILLRLSCVERLLLNVLPKKETI